jgi:hypothetical protein
MKTLLKVKWAVLTVCVFMFSQSTAQIGSDESHSILKSEMVRSPLGEWTDNITENVTLMNDILQPHTPVLMSTDSRSKFLKIEFSNPDKERITLIITDSQNNIVSIKHFKCKRKLKIGMHKVNCDEFKVNIYHNDGGVMLASQQFRKNGH